MLQRLVTTGYVNYAQLNPEALAAVAWLPREPHVPAGFTLPTRGVGHNGETTPGNKEIYAYAYAYNRSTC